MDFMMAILDYLLYGIVATLKQLVWVLGAPMVLALMMQGVTHLVRTRSARLMGAKPFYYFTAPGTVLHELSHALFCVLFGHRITAMKLFQAGDDGTLGYVEHSWNPKSRYQKIGNFFIGTGPIWIGSLAIYLSAHLLLSGPVFAPLQQIQLHDAAFSGGSASLATFGLVGSALWDILRHMLSWEHVTRWQSYLFLYLVFAVGSHVTLSPPDLKGAWKGMVALLVVLLLFNWATLWIGDFALEFSLVLARYATVLTASMLLALVLVSLLALLLLPVKRSR